MRYLKLRDPDSFEDLQFYEATTQIILRKRENERDWQRYDIPEERTVEYFRERLARVGEITRFDSFIDIENLKTVYRGSVKKDADGEEYFFCTYGPLTDLIINGTVNNVQYSFKKHLYDTK